MKTTTVGAGLATLTAVIWGGQFAVGKSALGEVDPFHLTTIRYGVAALILLTLLAVVEGPSALRPEGRGARLALLGTLGFAGFNLFTYSGLERAEPQTAALVTGLAPLLTALVLWAQTRLRPSTATMAALAVALAGVVLVVSGGNPASVVDGSIGWGDGLVLVGVFSFVLYTLGGGSHRDLSPLRYTALTAGYGWVAIALATAVATGTGLEPEPSLAAVGDIVPQLAYVTLLGAVVAVLSWNAAVGRIGPQNVSLLGNLIPVTAFAVAIAEGYRPGFIELLGALLTIGALLSFNLLSRNRRARTRVSTGDAASPSGDARILVTDEPPTRVARAA